MKTRVLILLLFSGLLMAACGMTWEGETEDPEVMELRSKTTIPLMSLAGTTWVKGDVMRSVKLDERGIIIPGETALVSSSPALPYGPFIVAWSFEEDTMIAYGGFRFSEGSMKKVFWFKRVIDPSTGKAFPYSVDKEHKTVTAPAFGLGPAPFDIYIFNPEEMVLLSAVPNGYYALSLRPAKYQEQEALSAAKGPGEAGFDESYAAVLAALEQDCKDLGMSEVETAAIRTSFVNSFQSVFGGESAAN